MFDYIEFFIAVLLPYPDQLRLLLRRYLLFKLLEVTFEGFINHLFIPAEVLVDLDNISVKVELILIYSEPSIFKILFYLNHVLLLATLPPCNKPVNLTFNIDVAYECISDTIS
jgi:hypothetical protein